MEQDFDQRRQELEQKKAALESLKEHSGYKLLLTVLQAQLIGRRAEHHTSPIRSMDDAFAAAARQGFMEGLAHAIASPEQNLTAIAGDLNYLYQEMQDVTDRAD